MDGCYRSTMQAGHSDAAPRGEQEGDDRSSDGRGPRLAALVGAAAALALLVPRLAPGVTFEDAGELVAAAHTFGVPHPPGYPLWTLAAGSFARVLGIVGVAPALACVWFSALTTACGCGALAFVLARRGLAWPSAALFGACAGLTPTVAAFASVCEVYGLAFALQALLIAIALDPRPRPRATWLVFGLGLAAHPGTLFLTPLVLRPSIAVGTRTVRELVRWALAFALGPALYLYVPLRSLTDPALDWGDPQTLARFADHVLRAQYDLGAMRSGADVAATLRLVFEQSFGRAWIVTGLGTLALIAVWRRIGERWWLVGTLLVATLLALGSVRYPLAQMEPFARWSATARLAPSFAPLFLILFATCGLALARLARRSGAAWLVPLVALGSLLAPDTLGNDMRGLDDASASRGAAAWSRDVLDEAPPNALLVVGAIGYTDVLGFPLVHAQLVEDRRPDVTVVDRQMLLAPWYREQLAARAPDLVPWLADLAAALPATADQGALHRAVGAQLGRLVGGSREIVWTDPPGPAARGGREWVPGRTLWFADAAPGAASPEPSAPWLADEPHTPWRELHRRLALERDLARADRLARAGSVAAAEALRRAARATGGPPDPRADAPHSSDQP